MNNPGRDGLRVSVKWPHLDIKRGLFYAYHGWVACLQDWPACGSSRPAK